MRLQCVLFYQKYSLTFCRCFATKISLSYRYGAERFEDGASQINKSDMYFGDDGDLTPAQLQHLDEVTTKNIKYVKMSEGDVVLLDNYKTMHGRNVFDGTRKHGVAWFGGWDGEHDDVDNIGAATTTTTTSKTLSENTKEKSKEFFFAQ